MEPVKQRLPAIKSPMDAEDSSNTILLFIL